jgi:hypothetical protein
MYIYSWKKIDKILTHFGDANYQKKICFGRKWCSTWQWSDLPVQNHQVDMWHQLSSITSMSFEIMRKTVSWALHHLWVADETVDAKLLHCHIWN